MLFIPGQRMCIRRLFRRLRLPTVMGLISSCLFIGIQVLYPISTAVWKRLFLIKQGRKLEMAENIGEGTEEKRDLKIWG